MANRAISLAGNIGRSERQPRTRFVGHRWERVVSTIEAYAFLAPVVIVLLGLAAYPVNLGAGR